MSIQRFRCNDPLEMACDPKGGYILYEDHLAALSAAPAREDGVRERLERTIDRLCDELAAMDEVHRLNRTTFTCTCAPESGRIRAELMKKYGLDREGQPINQALAAPAPAPNQDHEAERNCPVCGKKQFGAAIPFKQKDCSWVWWHADGTSDNCRPKAPAPAIVHKDSAPDGHKWVTEPAPAPRQVTHVCEGCLVELYDQRPHTCEKATAPMGQNSLAGEAQTGLEGVARVSSPSPEQSSASADECPHCKSVHPLGAICPSTGKLIAPAPAKVCGTCGGTRQMPCDCGDPSCHFTTCHIDQLCPDCAKEGE